jgi:short-subunit dehydrogenase
MKIESKVFIVTGGGSGLGRELVLRLLKRGAKVAAVDFKQSALQETLDLAGDLSANFSTHLMDITDRVAVNGLPQKVIKSHGQVDGLINNAGIIQPFVPVNDLDFKDIERIINVNFYGSLNFIKAFLPHLLKRPAAKIVNISSMGGFFPFPGQSIYGASKAAVKLMTEGLYAELLNTKVEVMAVFPGALSTNIAANSGVKIKGSAGSGNNKIPALSSKLAAEAIVKTITGRKLYLYVGKDSKFMNLFYKLTPKAAISFISKKMNNLL